MTQFARRSWSIWLSASAAALLALAPAGAAQQTVVPSRDNTLFGNDGSLSCGAGANIISGRTDQGALRRAVLHFDVAAAIPAGSVITGATMILDINRSRDGQDATMSLHRLLDDWGEGASDCDADPGKGVAAAAGDATWTYRFFNTTTWATAGGRFNPSPSASALVGTRNAATWSGAGLVADVQAWLDSPATNFGWIVIGDEARNKTARRFGSRENTNAANRPRLVVDFTPPVGAEACCTTEGFCSLEDPLACTGTVLPGVTSCTPNLCPQPQGACCSAMGACTVLGQADCSAQGGTFQGEGTSCDPNPCPGGGLEKFVDALPLPGVATPIAGAPGAAATYEIAITEFDQQLHRDLPPTRVWGYGGSYPGPTIEAHRGEPVVVSWINDLRDAGGALRTSHYLPVDTCPHGPDYWGSRPRTVVHLHGGHVPARYDGYPEFAYGPGLAETYVYPNHQLPGTLWYHDHSLGITRLNVTMGLAGFYLLRDAQEAALGLPAGEFEVPLAIQDRTFNPDGTFSYPATLQQTFYGDTILVNGKVWPFLEVKQGKYRFRMLGGSNSRTYRLSLSDGAPFQVIGTEGGLLGAPVTVSELTLASGERYDVVIDFAGYAPGTEILLQNDAPIDFPNDSNPTEGVIPEILKFIVLGMPGHTEPIPAVLRPVPPIPPEAATVTRELTLARDPAGCGGGEWLIDGMHWDNITEIPDLDAVEVWEWVNTSSMMHPMHMHLVMFQILERQALDAGGVPTGPVIPPEPYEMGWKDTAMAPPGTVTRVIAHFEDYVGKFAYHCHILEHEDHEMMRQFRVTAPGCDGDGVCEPGEDCLGCPADCDANPAPRCGDGLCEAGNGEDCATCPADCNGKQNGNPANQFCCGGGGTNPVPCSDARCTTGTFACRATTRPPACCGDAMCEGAEDDVACYTDCAPDADTDGFLEYEDCNESDPAAGSVPPEVPSLRMQIGSGIVRLEWDSVAWASGSGTVYDLFGGPATALRVDGGLQAGACLAENVPGLALDDPTADPAPGEATYFLVRGQNGCPGGNGTLGGAGRDAGAATSASPCS